MVSDNRSKSYFRTTLDKLWLFILSILSPIILLYRELHEKFTIRLLEIRRRILKIEKESISEDIKANIEKNILDLRKKHELFITRKETYLTYHERKKSN
jgi:hypothetical protein